ncbi:hypothetical protein KY320_00385 [Candidatus Woesearchaeota archaeon]|nr:hypothetical protein [Candidatus Woesearchaeota archaeon]
MHKKGRSAALTALLLMALVLVGFAVAAPKIPEQKPECMDKIDNDNDGLVDFDDPGCDDKKDIDETNCGDGVCEGGEDSGNCPADCGIADSCSDTDGGNLITVFGTASGYFNSNPYSNDDYCVGSDEVMEYYCSGNYKQSLQQSCGTDFYGSPYCAVGEEVFKDLTDYFCASGVCESSVTQVFQEDCDNADGYGALYCAAGNEIFRDYSDGFCALGACDTTVTPEFQQDCDTGDSYGAPYCSAGDEVFADYEDFFCLFGACESDLTPVFQEDCDDADGYSELYCVAGQQVFRDYTDGYCLSGACDTSVSPLFQEDCTIGDGFGAPYCVAGDEVFKDYTASFCASGACDANVTPVFQQDCDDNDGYSNNYCFGNAVFHDYLDWYCVSGGCNFTQTSEYVQWCPGGCVAGECIPPPDSCLDSDGGIDPFVNASVWGFFEGSPYGFSDYCQNSVDLKEFFCNGNYAESVSIACDQTNSTTICINGRCI